jgi:hypothetical protein
MIQFPPESVMHQLHAMSQAVGIDYEDGPLQAYIPDRAASGGYRAVEIDGETIDELVARGWCVLVGDDEIECTDQGVYWLRRWCALKDKEAARQRRGR